ncbi:MAG: PHP domain-containing protein [Bacillus sp. (in: Bacteria)]|nr:PHP domain-containing protein [Bacillus sp. (in: firmicutes)]MCM1425092.1 PHP domain-containing protein [Eubacterium sp.]
MMKLDMHCHTKEGSPDGKTALLDNIAILKQNGFDGMLITDHNSYKAYRYYKKLKNKPKNFTVLCGIEYDTLDAGHILIIMPSGIHPRLLEMRGLPVLILIEIVHRYGGILGPAHPCGEKFLSIFNTRSGKRLKEKLIRKFDFIEIFNACEDDISNDCAKALASKYHLPGVGGSDSHKSDCVGLGYTILPDKVANESELIRCIKDGAPIVAGGSHYFHTTKQKLGRVNKVLVYSFWFYNKFLAAYRSRARELELAKSKLRIRFIRHHTL